MNDSKAAVALAPGNGMLAVRHGELLFSPSGFGQLFDLVQQTPSGSLAERITSLVEDPQQQVVDFVLVEWSDGQLRLILCGDVEVTSDHRSLPRLSASGVGTWIERSLTIVDPVTVSVADSAVLDQTDLRLGIVPASGFRLAIGANRQLPVSPAEPEVPVSPVEPEVPVSPVEPEVPVSPVESEVPVPPANWSEPAFKDPVAPSIPPSAEPPVSGEVSPADREESRASDPLESAGSAWSPAADRADRQGFDRGATSAPVESPSEVLRNLPPPTGKPQLSAPPVDVDANPDRYLAAPDQETIGWTPEVRQAVMDLQTENIGPAGGPAPPAFVLYFGSDRVEPVDMVLIIGRRPSLTDEPQGTARAVEIADRKVSGTHVRVEPADGHILLTDLDSSNGSFIVASGDGSLVPIEARVPQTVLPGTTFVVGEQRIEVRSSPEP